MHIAGVIPRPLYLYPVHRTFVRECVIGIIHIKLGGCWDNDPLKVIEDIGGEEELPDEGEAGLHLSWLWLFWKSNEVVESTLLTIVLTDTVGGHFLITHTHETDDARPREFIGIYELMAR